MCVEKIDGQIRLVNDCLDVFKLNSEIPRELVHGIEDALLSVFSSDSKEMSRFLEYRDSWNSFDPKVRKEWLKKAKSDLNSAMSRLTTTPGKRFPALRLGAIENEYRFPSSTTNRLSVIQTKTDFNIRVIEICRRIDICLRNKCPDSVAFYVRKIVELTIIERYRKDVKAQDIRENDRIFPLEKLISKACGDAYLSGKLTQNLKKEKLFMDSSVHVLYYDLGDDEIDRIISIVKLVIAELRINEL